ncbi:MAG: hypothetical protein AAGH71_08170 [Planctomycetota bacterium]
MKPLADPITRFTDTTSLLERAIIVFLVSVNIGGLILAPKWIEFERASWLMPILGAAMLLAFAVPFVGRSFRSNRLHARLTRLSQAEVCCMCGTKVESETERCVGCSLTPAAAVRIHLSRCRWLVSGEVWRELLVEWKLRARSDSRPGVDDAAAAFAGRRSWRLSYGRVAVIAVGCVAAAIVIDVFTPFGRQASIVAMPVVVVSILWAFVSRDAVR